MESFQWLILREKIGWFLCLLGRRQNISPNSIRRNVKTHEGNVFILVIFIYVLGSISLCDGGLKFMILASYMLRRRS